MTTTASPQVAPQVTPQVNAIAPIVAPELTPQQQAAWVGMAQAKNNLVAELSRQELATQQILLNAGEQGDYNVIEAALAEYRKAHTLMVETRKGFTQMIDAGIIQPLMAFEKRVDPKVSQPYANLSNLSLQLRKAQEAEAQKANAIAAEVAAFKVHCENEYAKQIAAFRNTFRHQAKLEHMLALKTKEKPTPEQIRERLEGGIKLMGYPRPEPFTPRLLTNEQLGEIYSKDCRKPDWQGEFDSMLFEIKTMYATFETDILNAEAAVKAQEDAAAQLQFEEAQKAAEETAINTLIVQAETVTVETPTIKRTYTIAVVESEAWAKMVMAGFITNLPRLAKYIRVKSWAKLSIGQMAEYLAKLATDEEIKAGGLEYQEVEK
jgi:hypothetical protein